MPSKTTRREVLKKALGAAAASILAPGALAQTPTPRGDERPNIVLISLDTLRADHLGCYGYARQTSPAIDSLASAGALFRKAYSTTSWTAPAHASVLTGLYPPTHGINEHRHSKLPPGWPTVARALKTRGYSTKAIVSGPMVDRRFGFDQGFDDFDDQTYVASVDLRGVTDEKKREDILLYKTRVADVARRAAVRWLRAAPPEPWFLFLHLWDIHADYKPPPPFDRRFDPDYKGSIDGNIKSTDLHTEMPAKDLRHLMALYDGEIAWTDRQVGVLLEVLGESGMGSDTCVLLFSDHGDEFFEHGTKGHAHNLHESLIHIPMTACWAGKIRRGMEIDTPVSLADLGSTIIDLGGGTVPPWIQGRSLKPLLLGQAPDLPIVPLYGSLFFRGREMAYSLDYPVKCIHNIKDNAVALYNLEADPTELQDLSVMAPELADLHCRRMAKWVADGPQLLKGIMAGA